MRTIFLFFTIFLLTTSYTILMMYSLKLFAFIFLAIDFLTFSSNWRCENQSILGLGARQLDTEVV